MNVKRFISVIITRIRLGLVFVIHGHVTDISRKEKGHVCVNFVVGKRNSSKTKVRSIRSTPMWMLGLVARHLFSFTFMKKGSG